MKKILLHILVLSCFSGLYSQTVTTPEKFFGFIPGTDEMLFTYEQLIDYLKLLDGQSDKLQMVEIGKSPLGKPIYAACFSSAENLKNLENLKEINRKLALDASLDEQERARLVRDGKVFVLATMSMHSNEVGPSQSVPITAYNWLTTTDESILKALDNVVFMIVPCHNPDGMDMVVGDFNKTKGTKYEGSSFPGVYHKYVGHDNNRDFIILSQNDTKAISNLTSTGWFPQVMVEKHQMGSTGPRYFVQPNNDPIADNVDASLFIWTGIFGQQMISDMTKAGLKGVSQHTMFDNYWPGSTETCLWKNVIALLTEGASCQIAKPIYVEPTELTGWGKGLSEYKKSINMPEPWPGGWWRLGDIVQYELVSTTTILKTASDNNEKILSLRNELCKKEVMRGKTEAPYYYILPAEQRDQSELVSLVTLLLEHGIEVSRLQHDVSIGQTLWKAGDVVVSLAQPFRSFVKEVMEAQKYPERHYTPGGALIDPYDITSWSLPLHKGIDFVQIDTRSAELENALERITGNFSLSVPFKDGVNTILTSSANQAYRIAFEVMRKGIPVKRCLEDFVLDGKIIPAGSFLITPGEGTQELLKTADFPLCFSNEIPKANWQPVAMPRLGLIESNMHDMDAGWTRYILDTYSIAYTVLHPADFEKGNLSKSFDMLLFPDEDANVLKEGKVKQGDQYYLSSYRPDFTKGMGAKGFDSLILFFAGGGRIVSWGESTGLFDAILTVKTKNATEEFRLPFRNVADEPGFKELDCPGSLIRMNIHKGSPLTYGMGDEAGIFYRGKPLFTTSIPRFDMDRRVIGYFGEEKLLLSGFLNGEKLLTNKAAMIWVSKGKGRLVLMAFSPIFRASVPGNFKLLFNAILQP